MHVSLALLCWGIWTLAAFGNKILDDCLVRRPKYTMNVVLLEDNTYAWSRPYVQKAVEDAIEIDRLENHKYGRAVLRAPVDPQKNQYTNPIPPTKSSASVRFNTENQLLSAALV